MSTLEKAIEIAAKAHAGQKRFNGEPYILHSLRVMVNVKTLEEKIVAVLHDVVEDTNVTVSDLVDEGFSMDVYVAVSLLTHNKHNSYEEYINRIKWNDIARNVKIADMKDNIDILSIPDITIKDFNRLKKYHRYIKKLSVFGVQIY
jgi:(p)ppGpp synthase/HD superfamily hydrolase